MGKPSKPVRGYVSPVVLARAVLARAAAGERVSKQALSTARRIVALPSWVVSQLERHQAPDRVARWVAWGKKSELEQRAELAVLLRRSRSSKGWPDVRHLKAAFDVYREVTAGHFILGTAVSEVPLERYAAAIAALPKRQRRARNAATAAGQSTTSLTIGSEEDVLRALVAIRRPKRPRPPTIKLRAAPLRADDQPTASPAAALVGIERVVAENTRLREQHREAELKAALREVEAERQEELHGREIAELKAKIETLERERSAQVRSGGLAPWVVGLGSAAVGAMATEIVRRGVDLLHAEDTQIADAVGTLGGEALFMRLLPVFDNVTRAHRHAAEGAPSVAIAEGLRVVREQLDEVLARSGVERVPTVGQKFDPTRHEAVEHVDAPEPAGVVLREVLPGYMTGGRLLRAPTVIVSKGLAAATAP